MGQGARRCGEPGMKRLWIFFSTLVLIAISAGSWFKLDRQTGNADELILLLPDNLGFTDPTVALWLDAASEEGLHVEPVHDSEFVRPLFARNRCAGVILPDTIHKQASDVFVGSIQNYVSNGGKLMLVYDAATLSPEGRYAPMKSRLSQSAGVDYALYDKLQNGTIVWQPVGGPPASFSKLDIPPGKYYPFAASSPGAAPDAKLTRYRFGDLKYPSFVTAGNYHGRLILHSSAGVVAGENSFGKGVVLFVNLPLSYLKGNTDGLPLHTFLKYFAQQVVDLPYLASVPDGIGGIILNWHVDSNAAIKPLAEMESWSLLKQGPYSIHITAGPDAHTIGDHRGFDVNHNPSGQARIREYLSAGNEIGSHGGWVHDYFAAHVDTDPPDAMRPFLELNKKALENVTGRPVTEYSSPSGDQPEWVTQWLEANGFLAYYFTGDTGMGPTQGYREGVRAGKNIWAFPISHLGPAAAFEEMPEFGFQAPEILQWLDGMADFVSSHHTARLIYFHPPGILAYHDIVDEWMTRTRELKNEGRFRWYTMSGLAAFLNARKQVNWTSSKNGDEMTIDASHPTNLEHMTWRLPMARFDQPTIAEGSAQVSKDDDTWVVVAGPGQKIEIKARMLTQ
jgi:Polysaccharide deacetylase